MPSLVEAIDTRPRVFHRTIQIGPILFEEQPAEDDIVAIPGEGWSLSSSDNDFYPLVRMEVWDGCAVRPTEDWEYEREFTSPLLDRLGVFDLYSECYGRISLEPGPYRLRLLCRGRDHLEASLALDPFPSDGPHGDPLEFWVIQVWPDR